MALFKWQGSTTKDHKILKNSGFMRENVNQYLYVKKSVMAIVYIVFYVDDI